MTPLAAWGLAFAAVALLLATTATAVALLQARRIRSLRGDLKVAQYLEKHWRDVAYSLQAVVLLDDDTDTSWSDEDDLRLSRWMDAQ